MIEQILAFFGINLSVDGVMSQFNKAISRLEAVEEKKKIEADDARAAAAAEREIAMRADAEAARAATVRAKLKTIIEA
jgi:hypothetical protein